MNASMNITLHGNHIISLRVINRLKITGESKLDKLTPVADNCNEKHLKYTANIFNEAYSLRKCKCTV